MLTAFTAGLLLITISELGDKTFFIAAILAMRYPRRLVFAAVVTALAAMTVLSVLLGQTAALLPKTYIHYAEVVLFLLFGLKLLYEGNKARWEKLWTRRRATSGVADAVLEEEAISECEEAAAAVEQVDQKLSKHKTQTKIWLEAFVLTFLAEWGDRTQIATIVLAASNNPWGVTTGAILGHAICAAIAVIGGRMICGRISEAMLSTIGGVLFLIFAAVAVIEGAGA